MRKVRVVDGGGVEREVARVAGSSPHGWVVRGLLTEIERVASEVRDPDTTQARGVALLVAISHAASALRKEVEHLKEVLREAARATGKSYPVTIQGENGTFATVSAPEPILKLARSDDGLRRVEALRKILGEDNFTEAFIVGVQVQLRGPESQRILDSLPPAEREALFAIVQQDMGAGGVSCGRR